MSDPTESVLIAGCGYVGSRLAELLVDGGARVWGLRRDPDGLPDGVRPVRADVTRSDTLGDLPAGLDAVVYAVSPSGRSEEAYREAYVEGLRKVGDAVRAAGTPHFRLVLISSTGAYGYADGREVDEQTPPRPADATGERIVEAEGLARRTGSPGIALRLGGIYGPGRERTVGRVVDGEAGCPPPDRYTNRIHRDDAARAALHLLRLPEPAALYLGVDRAPVPLREVYRWIAERADAPDPCEGVNDGEAWEPRGRRRTNKRCSSDRLVASGFTFLYPTYREGYGALIDARFG